MQTMKTDLEIAMSENLRAVLAEVDSAMSLMETVEEWPASELVGQNLGPAAKHLAAARASLGLAVLAAEQGAKA